MQKSGGSIEQQAAKYCQTVRALVGTLPNVRKHVPDTGSTPTLEPDAKKARQLPPAEEPEPAKQTEAAVGKKINKSRKSKRSSPSSEIPPNLPAPRSGEVMLSRRWAAWTGENPIRDERTHHDQLSDWEVSLEINDPVKPTEAEVKKERHPVVEKLRVITMSPSHTAGGEPFAIEGWAFNRGMDIDTSTGVQVNRCLFIILACGTATTPEELYKEVLRDCTQYLDEVDDLTDEFAARAVAGVMTQEVQEHAGSLQLARSSANCVTTRSQPCEPSFMRVAWPYDARGKCLSC